MSKVLPKARQPIILRYHRLMDAFSKSDDERDFYLDTLEGFMLYADLGKDEEDLLALDTELAENPDRYVIVPKMSYYETKKFMEGFINEKVYDIDTKEKLLDIISSKEARENFLEYIYDNLTELEKWQQYYHERSRIRVIEWLRSANVRFVFEEDIDLPKATVEKLKKHLFDARVGKEVTSGRQYLEKKADTYYSSEALNPRPKRGRPPKLAAKVELEPQLTQDMYVMVPPAVRHFLFLPDFSSTAATFSAKFDTEAQLIASLRGSAREKVDVRLEALSQRLESLRSLSSRIKAAGDIDLGSQERAISAALEVDDRSPGEPNKTSKLGEVFKGVIPKRKEQEKQDIQEMIKQKRKA
ncbi:MAG: UPF0158 family protein, partial [Chlamydiia bacterium]|nr:UPF0158 family protein [Chlamydiia bacterium]